MPTLQDQNNKLDPGEQEYEKNFDFERHERELKSTNSHGADNPTEQASMDRAQAWSRDKRNLGEREAAPHWDTNLSPRGDGGGTPKKGGRLAKMAKKRATKWIVGGIITGVFSFTAGIPAVMSQVADNIKTLGTDWANKNNKSFFSKRTAKYLSKKYFKAEANADASKVKDRFNTGVSQKEIDQLKAAGLNPQVEKAGDKMFIKSLDTVDADGKKVTVDASRFQEHYLTNVKFRGKMDKVAKPSSMLMRGAQTIKLVFNKYKIKRNLAIEGTNDKERNKSFRSHIYGDGNNIQKANAPPSEGEKNTDEQNKIEGIDDSIKEAAQAERDRMAKAGYDVGPSIVPDTTNLDLSPDKAVSVANESLKGGVKGSVLGIFSLIDKACSGYQLIRSVIFGAKIYKVIGLIKYVGMFNVIFDKVRAGEGISAELGYLMGILMRPSTKPDSLGKTFFQSTGWNLVFQGKVADHRGLGRFTTGTPYIKYLQRAKDVFEKAGANKSTCKHVSSWYGQGVLIVAGLATSIFSAGTLAVAGVVAGAAIGMVVSVLMEYITPLLIQYAAGTISPDPLDAEGGFAAGNAMGAALGAFGYAVGKGNGLRALTKKAGATVEMESNKQMAFERAVENQGKNPFSLDSADSIPTRLAFAVAPYMSSFQAQGSVQSLAAVFASPFTMFGSSLGNIFNGGVNAQADTSNRQGDFCADEEYKEINLAVDANCNPIPGEEDAVINDPKYDDEAVIKYMLDNKHIEDAEPGNPKSDDYKKYIASCVDSFVPLSADGGGTDVGEDVDTRWCYSTDEKYTMFRFFIAQSAIKQAHESSVNGTLGIDDGGGDAGAGTALTGKNYQNGRLPDDALCALGSEWPGHRLRCDAAEGFKKMNAAFKQQFGKNITVTDSYRDYAGQVKCRQEKGNLCADPGTSNHGCGQAMDLGGGIQSYSSPEHKWLMNNGPATGGWAQPSWAVQGGSKPEPWHWEFGTNGQKNDGTCRT